MVSHTWKHTVASHTVAVRYSADATICYIGSDWVGCPYTFKCANHIVTLYNVEPFPTFFTLLNLPTQIELEVRYLAVTEN